MVKSTARTQGGLRTAVSPPFLHSFFHGDPNQQIHAEIVSVHRGVNLSAAEEKALPEEIRKDFAGFLQDYLYVLVKLENNQGYAQDTVVSLKGGMPKKGEMWIFTTPEPNSTHPFGERAAS